jgi:toxin ParE1/3/4
MATDLRLRWSLRARADLDRLAGHLAEDKPLAAPPFVAQLRRSVERLTTFPLLGRAGPVDDTRELVVHRYDLVTYRVRADEVQVLPVWRVARDRPRGSGKR